MEEALRNSTISRGKAPNDARECCCAATRYIEGSFQDGYFLLTAEKPFK
jgi:hypothetical protein